MKLALLGTGNGNSLARSLAIASMLAIGGFSDTVQIITPPKLEVTEVIEEMKKQNRRREKWKRLHKKPRTKKRKK